MPPRHDLQNRVALVTGGSRGIGKAVAMMLAESGADVVVNYRESETEALAPVERIHAMGRRAAAIGADVSESVAVAALFRGAVEALGPVDVLINNAGIATVCGLDDLTEAEFDRTIAVNLKSAFLCTQSALPHMKVEKWGRIVNISSGAARSAGGVGVHYNASKAGMEGLTRGYAARLVKWGITVNAVSPSLVDTDMLRSGIASAPDRVPLGRFGTGEEVAQAVLMVIGNAYMTGQTVQLNGGMHFI